MIHFLFQSPSHLFSFSIISFGCHLLRDGKNFVSSIATRGKRGYGMMFLSFVGVGLGRYIQMVRLR